MIRLDFLCLCCLYLGGAVGFLSYDCVQYFEPSTKTDLHDTLKIPDAVMMFFDTIVIFDHLYSLVKVCSNIFVSDDPNLAEIETAYAKAVEEIHIVETLLASPHIEFPKQESTFGMTDAISNVGEEGINFKFSLICIGYKSFVSSIKNNIKAGDVIQVVPSQRLKKKTKLHPFNAYRRLRTVNPSPYMFYVDLGDFQLVGASPEMLVKVEKGKVFMHPIAGMRILHLFIL